MGNLSSVFSPLIVEETPDVGGHPPLPPAGLGTPRSVPEGAAADAALGVDGREAHEGGLQWGSGAAAAAAQVVHGHAPPEGKTWPTSPVTLWNYHLHSKKII